MANKNVGYSIRLTEKMSDFLLRKSDEACMKPSEYLRMLLYREMEKERAAPNEMGQNKSEK
jgi:hypothetical protein